MTRKIKEITELEIIIGERLRSVRKEKGASLKLVAALIGVTLQQVEKYETAKNRISAATLHYLSQQLKVPPCAFYPQMETFDLHRREFIERFKRLSKEDQERTLLELISELSSSKPMSIEHR